MKTPNYFTRLARFNPKCERELTRQSYNDYMIRERAMRVEEAIANNGNCGRVEDTVGPIPSERESYES